jgi:hypothetical protein
LCKAADGYRSKENRKEKMFQQNNDLMAQNYRTERIGYVNLVTNNAD